MEKRLIQVTEDKGVSSVYDIHSAVRIRSVGPHKGDGKASGWLFYQAVTKGIKRVMASENAQRNSLSRGEKSHYSAEAKKDDALWPPLSDGVL